MSNLRAIKCSSRIYSNCNYDLWADVKVGVAGRAIAQVQKARDLSP